MRFSTLPMQIALLTATAIASDISLPLFQQISGFSAACTKAYDTPIQGCKVSDFKPGPCSQACADGLQQEAKLLNSACAGISASTNTLIGLFFQGYGVQALCPNIASGAASSSSASSSSSLLVSSSAPSSSSVAAPTSTSTSTSSSTISASSSDSTAASTSTGRGTSTSSSSSTLITSTISSGQIHFSISSTTSTPAATPFNTFGGDVGLLNSSDRSSATSVRLPTISVLLGLIATVILMVI